MNETRHWCPEKGIWIPWRKYEIKRNCGRFEPIKEIESCDKRGGESLKGAGTGK